MKKLFVVLTFILFAGSVSAQQSFFTRERLTNMENFDMKPLSWGYFLGFNFYDFNFDYINQQDDHNTDILVKESIGFNVGLVGDLRINNNINLRLEPGLYFTQRNLTFPGFVESKDYFREVKSTYIHIPLLLKVSTNRLNNFKPFVVAGISTAFNLSSNENNPDDNRQGNFRMKSTPMFYEIGFGIDFYLFYFKFTPSIRGVFAMTNELVPDNDINSPWTSNIENLATHAVFINFTFQ